MAAMATTDITTAVRRYLAEVANGTASSIAALYASDATVEDPVGNDAVHGTAAIAEFYRVVESAERETELLAIKVAGDTAAFHFRVISRIGERTITVEPIDVMTFDSDLKITSMRAHWSEEDLIVGPAH